MYRLDGWVKDKFDDRDKYYETRKTVELPDIVDLGESLPEVRNQGSQGSCVGHGIGGIITGKAKQLGVYKEWESPRWIYYGGRYLGGYVNQDCGTEPRLSLEWCRNNGCLLESMWPYEEQFNPAAPDGNLFIEAAKRPLLSYTRVVDGIDGICSALAGRNLVAIGSPWYDKWSSTDGNGRLKKIYCWDSVAGGHEYMIYGYNRIVKVFYCQNSWGKDYGIAGKMYLPFQAIPMFKKHGGYDAHIINVEWQNVGQG
jgi:hypothetical protein